MVALIPGRSAGGVPLRSDGGVTTRVFGIDIVDPPRDSDPASFQLAMRGRIGDFFGGQDTVNNVISTAYRDFGLSRAFFSTPSLATPPFAMEFVATVTQRRNLAATNPSINIGEKLVGFLFEIALGWDPAWGSITRIELKRRGNPEVLWQGDVDPPWLSGAFNAQIFVDCKDLT